jgi:hypothetical protein
VIIDDRDWRREAERRGLRVIGTLRVLYDAAEAALLELAEALEALHRCGFYVDRRLAEEVFKSTHRKGKEIANIQSRYLRQIAAILNQRPAPLPTTYALLPTTYRFPNKNIPS